MLCWVIFASYFSLLDSRNLADGNCFPRLSEDYNFSGASIGFYVGKPGLDLSIPQKHMVGSDFTLRVYDYLFRAGVFKGKGNGFYDEAMEMSVVSPLRFVDSVYAVAGLRTSHSSDSMSVYTPGFALKIGAFFAGKNGDIGLGLTGSRDSAIMALVEMNRFLNDQLSWGTAYSGGLKGSKLTTSFRVGEDWGFTLTGGAVWMADSAKIRLWPAFSVDYEGYRWRWNLAVSYNFTYGQYQPVISTGLVYRKPYEAISDTGVVVAKLPIELLPGKFGTSKNSSSENHKKTRTSRSKTHNGSSQQNKAEQAQSKPKVSQEEIETLYLKGVEAYRWEDFATAIYYWQKVLELDPNHTKARRGIERAKKYLQE